LGKYGACFRVQDVEECMHITIPQYQFNKTKQHTLAE